MPYKNPEKQRQAKCEWAQKNRIQKKITEKITLIRELTIEKPEDVKEFTFTLTKSVLKDLIAQNSLHSDIFQQVTKDYKSDLDKLTYTSEADYLEKMETMQKQCITLANNNVVLCDIILLHPASTERIKKHYEELRNRLESIKAKIEADLCDFQALKAQGLIPYKDPDEKVEV